MTDNTISERKVRLVASPLPESLRPQSERRHPRGKPWLGFINQSHNLTPAIAQQSMWEVGRMLEMSARHHNERDGLHERVHLSWATIDPHDPVGTANVLGFGKRRTFPIDEVALISVGVPFDPSESSGPSLWIGVTPLQWLEFGLALGNTEYRAIMLEDVDHPDEWPEQPPLGSLFNAALVAGRQIVDVRKREYLTTEKFEPIRFRCRAEVFAATADGGPELELSARLPWNVTPILQQNGTMLALDPARVEINVPGVGYDVCRDGYHQEIPDSGTWAIFDGNIREFALPLGPVMADVKYKPPASDVNAPTADAQ